MIFKPHFKSFLRDNWIVAGLFVLSLVAIVWFTASSIGEFLYFNDPANKDVALKGWMTPKYIVLTYDLPRPLVADMLGLTSMDQRGTPMRDVATEMGVTLDELTDIVRAAAAAHRAGDT